jgi:nitrite reductase/ring-hydroxylating ferredoxin subunit
VISPREIDTTRVLCSLAELQATGSHGFAVGEGDWPLRGFVVKTSKGIAAYVNYCPHAGHPLNIRPNRFLTPAGSLILCCSPGALCALDGGLSLCCSHGALFARDDGLCIAGPCLGQRLTPVPFEVFGDYVMLGEGVDVERLANAPL